MRKTTSILAVMVCGLWGASKATASTSYCDSVASNLVTNCGFETGDFTGWTISGSTDNPGNPPAYYDVDTFDANTGTYGAYMSQDLIDDGTAPVDLSQTLATVFGVTYTVDFFLEQDTAPDTGYTHAFTATWGATTLLSLTPTVGSPGTVGSFTEYTYAIAATGPSTVLTFAFENDDQYWSFDDVSVTANSSTPEPSTALLAGSALGALLLLRKYLTRRAEA